MRTITIGRSNDNEFVIASPEVSGHHACVTLHDNGTATIKDVGSKNGTYVNGKKVFGDTVITLGDRVLVGNTPLDLNRLLPAERVTTPKAKTVGVQSVNVGKNDFTIGRASDNAIIMPQGEVSSHHAVLSQDASGVVRILDTNSTNGTFVNGRRVTSAELHRGDKVSLANRYPLDWERYVQANSSGKKPKTGLVLGLVGGIAAFAAMVAAVIFLVGNGKMSETKIYEKYNSSVVMVVNQFGYKIEVDGGKDITGIIFRDAKLVNVVNGELVTQPIMATGTGFFISEDGKLATNLHVARPWLFSEDISLALAQYARNWLAANGLVTYVSQVKVTGESVLLGVIPNGLPLSNTNLTQCREFKCQDSKEKDVAVLQTETHKMPNMVEAWVNLDRADEGEKALKPGNKIYAIGFPAGISDVSMTFSDMTLHNQIQGGTVTQVRDAYSFGHNAPTTHGASGSPIFNDRGRLIGVINAGVDGTQGFNTGIKVKYLKELLNEN